MLNSFKKMFSDKRVRNVGQATMQVLKYHRHFYNKCILTSRVLEIVVALVVEHLVGRQIHRRVQQLKRHRGLKGEIHKIVSFFVDGFSQRPH